MLEDAIAVLGGEVDALGIPQVGTSLWYIKQAKSLGLSMLKAMQAKGINDPVLADRFRKDLRQQLQQELQS